jgi:hypothetical protein
MATTLLGYNLILKADTKTFAAVTSNSFSMSPEIKDSITKDDVGVKRKVQTGYSWEIAAEGLVTVKESGETTIIDRNDIIAAIKAKTVFDVVYGQTTSGSKVQAGEAIITAFSESSDSENEATYSVTLGGVSALTEQTLPL